ncbi:hypothetical protein FD755_000634 [Muntiacus reevesi]|uniref:Ig-like domain-containing protein n=1 Tax=Muntiacus reevesi TaxID=9886 RepID=A0A5J5MYY9_MUNRE|nr:hypothetical protein FD755_000634 [Muntiacus reevesi]
MGSQRVEHNLVTELSTLCHTPEASQTVIRGFLGQSVTLPCIYSSWSPNGNSMCWGKGECPNSKCNDELLYTDGTKVVSRKSPKYQLQGIIQRGDVSLTIINTSEGDKSVYCCRIEVPGWFNDVKMNIRLDLRRAPTTTRSTTTRRPTTTTYTTTAMTTVTAVLPTTVVTTSELTSTPPLQMRTTAVLTTAASVCPLTTLGSFPEEDTTLLTLEPSTEGPILTAALTTFQTLNSEVKILENNHETVRRLRHFNCLTPTFSCLSSDFFLFQNQRLVDSLDPVALYSGRSVLLFICPSFLLPDFFRCLLKPGKHAKGNCYLRSWKCGAGQPTDALVGTGV